jgi:predicted amino acid racemase
VLDITDCEREYKVGDIIEFAMKYSALMNASYSRHVSKKYID